MPNVLDVLFWPLLFSVKPGVLQVMAALVDNCVCMLFREQLRGLHHALNGTPHLSGTVGSALTALESAWFLLLLHTLIYDSLFPKVDFQQTSRQGQLHWLYAPFAA